MARKIEIDVKKVEGYILNGSPVSEVADLLGVSESTIRRKCGRGIAKARATRRMLLRKLQWGSAENGSVPMQIFLGIHELGQREMNAMDQPKTILRRITIRSLVHQDHGSHGDLAEASRVAVDGGEGDGDPDRVRANQAEAELRGP